METETAFVIWTLLVWVGGFASGLVISTRKGSSEEQSDV
jgi:hypothetical protein